MAEGYDVNAGMTAAQQAVEAQNTNIRRTMAFNALKKVYGDVAGDPAAALKMQEYGQNEQLNPIAVDQAKANLTGTNLENTGRSQTNALNAAMNPEKIAQAQETTREQPQIFQTDQAAKKAQTGLTQASTAHVNVETQTAKQALSDQQNATAGRVLNGLVSLRDQGGDYVAAYQRLAPTLVKMGVIPADRAGVIGQAIQTKPDYLDQLVQAMGYGAGAKGMTMVPASDDPRVMVSVPTSSLPKSQPGVQYTANRQTGAIEGHPVTGTPQAQKFEAGQRTVNQEMGKARLSYDQSEVRFKTTQDNISQALSLVQSGAGLNSLSAVIPGTPAANLKAVLNSVHSDMVNTVIQGFKESTPKGQASGVGRVMQAEIKLWEDAFASTQQSSSPTILRANLQRLQQITGQLQQSNRLYNKSVYGFDPNPSPGNGGELPGGFKYLGPKK